MFAFKNMTLAVETYEKTNFRVRCPARFGKPNVGSTMNGFVKGLMSCAILVLVACGSDVPQLESSLAEARAASDAGDYVGARLTLKSAVQQFPGAEGIEARRALAELHLRLSGEAEALKEISKAIELGLAPQAGAPLMVRALLQSGKIVEAGVALEDAQLAHPSTELDALQGRIEIARGDYDAAAATLTKVIAADPESAEALFNLARLHAQRGEVDLAMNFAKRSVAADETHVDARNFLGGLQYAAGDHAAAIETYRIAQKLNPVSAVPVTAIIRSQIDLKAYDDARAEIATAQQKFQDRPALTFYLGLIEFREGNGKKAEDRFLEVLSVAPASKETLYYLGLLNYANGNLEQSEYYLNLAAHDDEEAVGARKILALVQLARSNGKGAAETLGASSPDETDLDMIAMRARAFLAAGNTEQGLAEIKLASALAPDADLLRASLALTTIKAGRHGEAIAMLQPDLEKATKAEHSGLLLMYTHLNRRAWDEAIAVGNKVIDTLKAEPPLVMNALGMAYMGKEQPDKAREYFERGADAKTEFSAASRNLVLVDLQNGDFASADRRIEAALKEAPDDALTLTLAGRSSLLQGDKARASSYFERAVELDPTIVEALIRLATLDLESGNLGRSANLSYRAVQISPNNVAAVLALAEALVRGGRLKEAKAAARRALELAPESAHGFFLNGLIQTAEGAPEQARTFFIRAYELATDNSEVTAALATSYLQSRDFNEASKKIAALEKGEGGSARVHALKGDLAAGNGNLAVAIEHYQSALELADSERTIVKLAQAEAALGHSDRAAAIYADGLQRHPASLALTLALAGLHEQNGDDAAAIAGYEQVLAQTRDSVIALNNLALLKFKGGDPQAVKLAAEAYKLAAEDPNVQDTYGWLLIQAGDVEQGLKLLQSAAQGLAGDGEVAYHLAVAYSRSKSRKKAVAELERALKLAPFASRTRAEDLLAALKN